MKKTILLATFVFIQFSYAQSGKISYIASFKIDSILSPKEKKQVDSLGIDKKQTEILLKNFAKNNQQVEFTLTFNKKESLFKKDEILENDNEKGINITALLAGGDIYYTAIDSRKILQQKDSFGEKFLITSDFVNWKLSNETKKIGNHICKKATTIRTFIDRKGKVQKKPVIAWYATDIPIAFGPKNYCGLPGLIIQLFEGKLVFTANRIKLNQKKELKIHKPKSDAEMTKKEYEERSINKFSGH
jgi:GLPGLI family protein